MSHTEVGNRHFMSKLFLPPVFDVSMFRGFSQDAEEAWCEMRRTLKEASEADLGTQALLHWMKLEGFLGIFQQIFPR